jgi:hypothetical protein
MFTTGEENMVVYVADVIDGAKETLMKLLALKFYKGDPNAINFKAIHKALLKNPKGVRVNSFDGATAIPEEVCVHLRRFHAFVYHYPSKQYRYAGKEYESAAKEL